MDARESVCARLKSILSVNFVSFVVELRLNCKICFFRGYNRGIARRAVPIQHEKDLL
jgi:hypothetical protein